LEQLHCKGPVFHESRFSSEYFVSKHLTDQADLVMRCSLLMT